MFEEDHCPRSSPDLWKESLDKQETQPETQPYEDSLIGNSDIKSEEGSMSDDTTFDSDITRMSIDDNDLEVDLNDDCRLREENTRKLTGTSNSSLINSVQDEADNESQIPSGTPQSPKNNRFKLKSPRLELTRIDNNERIIIVETSESETSESDCDTRAPSHPWITVKSFASLKKSEADVENSPGNSNAVDNTYDQDLSLVNPEDRLFITTVLNNNPHLNYKMLEWLEKNKNESLWKENKREMEGKGFCKWEQKCMLYYLIYTNKMDKGDFQSTWTAMKQQYQFLPHRSAKSLVKHFTGTLKAKINQFKLPDDVIKIIQKSN